MSGPWEKYQTTAAPAEAASAAQEPASAPVAPPSSADQATAKNDAEFAAAKKKLEKDYEEKTAPPSGMSKVQFGEFQTEIPTFFTTSPGMVTGLAAAYGAGVGLKKGVEAGGTGIKKVYDSLRDFHKDKFGDDGLLANQQAEKAAAQDLATSTPQEASAKVTPKAGVDVNANVGKSLNPTDTELLNKSVAIPEKKAVAKDVAAAEKAMAQGVEKGLPPPTLTTGTGKPAYPGKSDTTKFKSSYATPDAVPKGYAFVPNAQYIDPLRVNLGQETYTSEFKTRDFPTTYKGSPTSAIEVSNEINRGLNRPTRAQLIEQGAKLPENVKGITKEVSKSKLVKVAGVGGALIALSDLANAATPTEAALRSVDIATDYVPVVGQVKQALTPLEAGMPKQKEESIIASKFKEAQKLGSPYRSVPPPR